VQQVGYNCLQLCLRSPHFLSIKGQKRDSAIVLQRFTVVARSFHARISMHDLLWAWNAVLWKEYITFVHIGKIEVISALLMHLSALECVSSWCHPVLLTHALGPIDISSAQSEIHNRKSTPNVTAFHYSRLHPMSNACVIGWIANEAWWSFVWQKHQLRLIDMSSARIEVCNCKSTPNDTTADCVSLDCECDGHTIAHTANDAIVDMRFRPCMSSRMRFTRAKSCSWYYDVYLIWYWCERHDLILFWSHDGVNMCSVIAQSVQRGCTSKGSYIRVNVLALHF